MVSWVSTMVLPVFCRWDGNCMELEASSMNATPMFAYGFTRADSAVMSIW